MEIELAVKILQVAMTIDETWQHGLTLGIDDLGACRNRNFAAATDCLELTRLNNDDGILDRRPARAIDQFSTLYHEDSIRHDLYLPWSIRRLLQCGFIANTVGAITPVSAKYLTNRFNVNARVIGVVIARNQSLTTNIEQPINSAGRPSLKKYTLLFELSP
jgi:hypothetical protein